MTIVIKIREDLERRCTSSKKKSAESYWLKIWRSSGARRKVEVNPTFRPALHDRSSNIIFQLRMCRRDRLENRLVEIRLFKSRSSLNNYGALECSREYNLASPLTWRVNLESKSRLH